MLFLLILKDSLRIENTSYANTTTKEALELNFVCRIVGPLIYWKSKGSNKTIFLN